MDEFVLSMNRAAEKAAPQAKSIFVDAIKEMTFEDAKQILNGGDTAATEFFKEKTSAKLSEAFKPIVSSSVDEVGATRNYKEMMEKYTALPFMKAESLDLDTVRDEQGARRSFLHGGAGGEQRSVRTRPRG